MWHNVEEVCAFFYGLVMPCFPNEYCKVSIPRRHSGKEQCGKLPYFLSKWVSGSLRMSARSQLGDVMWFPFSSHNRMRDNGGGRVSRSTDKRDIITVAVSQSLPWTYSMLFSVLLIIPLKPSAPLAESQVPSCMSNVFLYFSIDLIKQFFLKKNNTSENQPCLAFQFLSLSHL